MKTIQVEVCHELVLAYEVLLPVQCFAVLLAHALFTTVLPHHGHGLRMSASRSQQQSRQQEHSSGLPRPAFELN